MYKIQCVSYLKSTVPLMVFVSNKEKLTLATWRLWELLNPTWAEKHSMRKQGSPRDQDSGYPKAILYWKSLARTSLHRFHYCQWTLAIPSSFCHSLRNGSLPNKNIQLAEAVSYAQPGGLRPQGERSWHTFFPVGYIQWKVFLLNWKESGFLYRYRVLKITCKYSLFL